MAVLAVCPSRGRPAAAEETLASFRRTVADPKSRLLFLVDSDDPTRHDYPDGHTRLVRPAGNMGGALQQVGQYARDATVVGMVGDDNRFRSAGWDTKFDDHLTNHLGIAFGDDGHTEAILADRGFRLPTSWWLSRPVFDRFGLAPAWLRHYWMDNYWLELGTATNSLTYFPDVLIEHLNPLWGTAPEDSTYERGSANAARDRAEFAAWVKTGKAQDISALRGVVAPHTHRVLADWHHPALWESLAILFEDRFGWELYSPTDMEWADKGFWKFTHEAWRAPQYLERQQTLADGFWTAPQAEYPERQRKTVTLEQADALRPDIVLASVPQHEMSFRKLADRWGARLVYQMGNARQPVATRADLVIASVNPPINRRVRTIRYHQEFSSELFRCRPLRPHDGPPQVASLMLRIDKASGPYGWLSDVDAVEWHDYGGVDPLAPDYLTPMKAVAEAMAAADWIWHDKKIGDGYGHVLHNAAAMGRPLIGHGSYYKGKIGAPFWRNLETCIDLDVHTPAQALRLVTGITQNPQWHQEFGHAIRATFEREVNFQAEADEIWLALV